MTPLYDRDGWIWQDGEWRAWRDAKVHVLSHTLHYGMGCFEGVRAYAGPNGTHLFVLPSIPAGWRRAPIRWICRCRLAKRN
ncbi:hypothetical protein HORIV_09830 [Vreelandella olivaria]|uniref:Branched-chain-amino-acid transaminase n=1 Tax=Vreelandella olivaria TaxID=390919 RepID=A0ABN5WRK2_9GAMM|nr:hypothetical protein HORIV_09830 [Halomonas olivaria]